MGTSIFDKLVMLITALVFCFLCFGMPFFYPDYFSKTEVKIEVLIKPGMAAGQAARAIRDAGVAADAKKLAYWMVKLGIDKSIKPGVYVLTQGSERSVVMELQKSKPVTAMITIVPGMSFKDAAKLFYKGEGEYERFLKDLEDETLFPEKLRPLLPDKARDRAVFLLPETYAVASEEENGKALLKRAISLWYQRVGKKLPENINTAKLMQCGVIASIVEKEARVNEERPILAGIFLKRLDKNMRLQSCATVIYAWEERGLKKKRLLYKDLEIDSPFNTYKNDGLPPSPISIPSEMSWISAINPQATEYLFFFASDNGRHTFSKTFAEHSKKLAEARQ